MQTQLTDIDDFPSRCDAWLACIPLLLAFVFIFLQCLMAYIKRFFGTVYFKRATCYLWRVERLCVYDQNVNTTNLHSVILDDGIANYFRLRIYIGWYNKTDSVFLRNENKHLFHLFLTYDTFYYDFILPWHKSIEGYWDGK